MLFAEDKEVRKIAITVPYFYPSEAADIAKALTERGFWRVHVRKPDAPAEEVRALLVQIPAELRSRLSIHYYFDLATEFDLGGVHLNSQCPEAPEGWNGMVSRSLHSLEEVKALTSEDYAFLSPVYPSISKPGYSPRFSLDEPINLPEGKIFALGGVTEDKLPELLRLGFTGGALLGAAWRTELNLDNFGLQLITHPRENLSVVDGARASLEGGCRWVQLRDKDTDTETLISEGMKLSRLCRTFGATYIIDDHVELVDQLGADGVHLGKNDMPVSEARKILGPGKIIGATANTFDDLKAAAIAGADYVGVGPFRFTITKRNLSPVLGLEGYRKIVEQCRTEGINIPIVAIGGIAESDIPAIMQTGVSGVAISGTILGAENPSEKTSAVIEIIRKNRNI